jgi:DNA-binding transcriptional LysR family regulator
MLQDLHQRAGVAHLALPGTHGKAFYLELRHFRCFVAVAEELHFGHSAQRLNRSQPPVSLTINERESELGLRLFGLTSRRIARTPQGEYVLRDARAIRADRVT